MEGTGKPQYDKCVEISTNASLKEMMLPGILTIGLPLIITFLPMKFGMNKLMVAEMLGGYMAGVTVSGVLWAIFQNNAGGAWDNAKKSFEAGVMINGEMTHKGSAAHEAAITGDTVGDPFKDTSGPSMNILIKLTCLIGLVIAPILGQHDTVSAEVTKAHDLALNQQKFEKEIITSLKDFSLALKADSYVYNSDSKTIEKISFDKIKCQNNGTACLELMKIANEKKVVFKANAAAVDYKESNKFNKKVTGVLEFVDFRIETTLLFFVRGEGKGSEMLGVFIIPAGSLEETEAEVTVYVKGRTQGR
jgi:K(+)-stimulated pyrophosphate-energized sodium pump